MNNIRPSGVQTDFSTSILGDVHSLINLVSERAETFSSQVTSVNDEHVPYPEVI